MASVSPAIPSQLGASPDSGLPEASAGGASGSVTVIEPPRLGIQLDLGELWAWRHTLRQRTGQAVRLAYDDLGLGIFWAVVRPLIMLFVFWAFKGIAGANMGVELPYPAYLFSGLALWFFFTGGVMSAAKSLSKDSGVLKKVYFPRLISPLSAVLAEAFNLLPIAIPMAIVIAFTGQWPDAKLLLLPLVLLQGVVLILGLGMIFSSLSLMQRDFERILQFGLYVGMWLSPVIYSATRLPEWIRPFYTLNPVYGFIQAGRACLFGDVAWPLVPWLWSLGVAIGLLALGVVMFKRAERTLVDRL